MGLWVTWPSARFPAHWSGVEARWSSRFLPNQTKQFYDSMVLLEYIWNFLLPLYFLTTPFFWVEFSNREFKLHQTIWDVLNTSYFFRLILDNLKEKLVSLLQSTVMFWFFSDSKSELNIQTFFFLVQYKTPQVIVYFKPQLYSSDPDYIWSS